MLIGDRISSLIRQHQTIKCSLFHCSNLMHYLESWLTLCQRSITLKLFNHKKQREQRYICSITVKDTCYVFNITTLKRITTNNSNLFDLSHCNLASKGWHWFIHMSQRWLIFIETIHDLYYCAYTSKFQTTKFSNIKFPRSLNFWTQIFLFCLLFSD